MGLITPKFSCLNVASFHLTGITNESRTVFGSSSPWLGHYCPICHTKPEQTQQNFLLGFTPFSRHCIKDNLFKDQRLTCTLVELCSMWIEVSTQCGRWWFPGLVAKWDEIRAEKQSHGGKHWVWGWEREEVSTGVQELGKKSRNSIKITGLACPGELCRRHERS